MRVHPVDGLLFLLMKILKSFDGRQTDLGHFNPDTIRSILIVSSTAIGDTLLSTPAIRAVRERYPRARIVAHFNDRNRELFENNPNIDGVVPYYGGYRKFISTLLQLRRYHFDLVLIFHGNEPQATPMAYLSGAPFIVKFPVSKTYGFLLSNEKSAFEMECGIHAISIRLRMASLVGCASTDQRMTLIVDEAERSFIHCYLREQGIAEDTVLVGLQAGAARNYKVWPEKNFVELGRRIRSQLPRAQIVLTGSVEERPLCDAIAGAIGDGALTVAGVLSLKQAAALIEAMNLLVTNDTGTMHMAVALGTRTVSLFCPTDAWGVGPSQDMDLHRVIQKGRPCNPCITKKCRDPFCMEQITVDEVYEAVTESLEGSLRQ